MQGNVSLRVFGTPVIDIRQVKTAWKKQWYRIRIYLKCF